MGGWDYPSGGVALPVSIANGGTGQTTKAAAFDALAPAGAKGTIAVHDGAGYVGFAVGADGDRLTADSIAGQGLDYETPAAVPSLPLAIVDGGTGQTTKTAAFDALSPLTTKGDILAHDATNNIRFGVGADDRVLTAAAAAAPGFSWQAGGGGGGDTYDNKIKLADQAKTNDATVAADGDLIAALAIGRYTFTLAIFANEAANNPNMNLRMIATGGLVAGSVRYAVVNPTSSAVTIQTDLTTNTLIIIPGGADVAVLISGSIDVTTAGNLAFGWAQATSDADALTLQENSSLLITEEN